MVNIIQSWLPLWLINNPIFLSISTLISEDLAFIYGLFSVKSESMNAIIFITFYTLGVLVGDILLYGVGVLTRKYSHLFIVQKLLKLFPKVDPNRSFEKFGIFEEFLIFTRFIPGTRLPTYIYCGIKGYSLFSFISILSMSTFVYSLLGISLILLSDGIDISNTSIWLKIVSVLLVSLTTIGIFKSLLLCKNLKRKYGEVLRPLRILIFRLRFLEFLPTVVFYLPFVPYFVYLLIRYRGFSAALSSNPGISMSGFVGELKSDIDKLILKHIPSYRLKLKKIDIEEELISQISNFEFPFIAKPDSGMRGTGVTLINNLEELEEYSRQSKKSFIIQEYYESNFEWGVFYYRMPDDKKGHVFSITDKGFPLVIGNGVDNIYELVLKDPYKRNRFDWIFSDSSIDPFLIPKDKEKLVLNVRGSHSKGCIFWNGESYLEEEYTSNLKSVLDKLPGFNIGRVDVRFKSFEGLLNGEFKLIEINGSGAESGNMYDPDMSYLETYKILIKQWSLIFKIGDLNKRKNINRDGLYCFFKTILSYK